MRRGIWLAIAGGLVLWWWSTRDAQANEGGNPALDTSTGDATGQTDNTGDAGIIIGGGMTAWNPARVPAQYAPTIRAAEQQEGLPFNLLARQLYQESGYDPAVIDGQRTSRVGALGIAQFMPATAGDLGIDPLDPDQAIPAAAHYLKTLYNMTGSWAGALAAYNWGIGNLRKYGIAKAPAETRNYYTQILADIGMPAIFA